MTQLFLGKKSMVHDKKQNKNKNNSNNNNNNKPRQRILGPSSPSSGPINNNGTENNRTSKQPPNLTHYRQVITTLRQQQQRQGGDSIACPHFGACSGCAVESRVYDTPVVRSARSYFSSTAVRQRRIDVREQNLPWAIEESDDGFYTVIVPSTVASWRTQAKLAVASSSSSAWSRSEGCTFGLYARRSHDVSPIPGCAVHHPAINRAVRVLQDCTAQVGTPATTEKDGSSGGTLRYIMCQVERSTGKICLTMVWQAATLKQTQPSQSRLIKALQGAAPDLWHSMWCHCNDSTGNAIFHRDSRRWHRMVGPEYLREPIPTARDDDVAPGWLYFTPMTFRQGNMDGFSVLAVDVAKAVPANAKVCELYAGVGVLGLTALAHHHDNSQQRGRQQQQQQQQQLPLQWIRCSDENPNNVRCFQRAVESLPSTVTGVTQNRHAPRRVSSSSSKQDGAGMEGMTLAELAKYMEQEGQDDPIPQSSSSEPTGPKTSYLVASAAQALRSGQALGANVMIVDPPRRGLEEEVLEELCKPFNPNQPYVESASLLSIPDDKIHWANDVRTLIYVSCGFDALARDSEQLLKRGWELEKATGYVLFPGSDHVETVAIFQR